MLTSVLRDWMLKLLVIFKSIFIANNMKKTCMQQESNVKFICNTVMCLNNFLNKLLINV